MIPESKDSNRCLDAGPKTVAVLRAELGDVQRFARTNARDRLRRHGHRDQRERPEDRARQSFKSEGVACCDACSTWPRCAASPWTDQLVELTITVWWSAVSRRCQHSRPSCAKCWP